MEKRFLTPSEEDYAALASEIKSKLRTPCYFTGVAETETACGEVIRLTASIILYRRNFPNERFGTIYDITPVWWDVQCEDEEGVIFDEFDFERLKEALMEEE